MGIANSVLQEIIKEVAEETGLSERMVDKMNKSQFKFARELMAEGDKINPESFKNIYWQHLGKLVLRPSRIKQMEENAGDKDS
jgi:hypothetical protein